MNDQTAKLEKQWTKFKKLPMPPAMADLKEELAIMDTYMAGLVSSYLSGEHIEPDDVHLNDLEFERKIKHFQPSGAHEEVLLIKYKQYKSELDKLTLLLKECSN